MTKEQIERRFAAIDALPPEELTPEEQQNLAKAQAMDDGSAVSLEQFQRSVEDYSGKLNIRIPRSLHRDWPANPRPRRPPPLGEAGDL